MWESIMPLLGGKSIDALVGKMASRKKMKGQEADLLDELKQDLQICRLVMQNGADPKAEGVRLSREVYLQLRRDGYKFNRIRKGGIPEYDGMKGTNVAFLKGKSLSDALLNVSDRIREIHTLAGSTASLEHFDLKRRMDNLAKRLVIVIRFMTEKSR